MALEKAALTIGGLYNAADVMVTADGQKMVWPTANDTANEGKQIDEVTAESLDGVKPTVGSFQVTSFDSGPTSSASAIKRFVIRRWRSPVSWGAMIGERLARIIIVVRQTGWDHNAARHRARPYRWRIDGQRNDLHVGGPVQDQVLDRRCLPRGRLVDDERRSVVQLMLITDENGRPILIEPQDGSLPRLLQRPVVTNNHMVGHGSAGTVASGRPALVYGDLRSYKLRLVGQIRTMRYVERFAEFDQTGFDGKRGADGGLLNAGTPPSRATTFSPHNSKL